MERETNLRGELDALQQRYSPEIKMERERSAKLQGELDALQQRYSSEIKIERERSAKLQGELDALQQRYSSEIHLKRSSTGGETSVHKSSDFQFDGTASEVASSVFEGVIGIQVPDTMCGPCHKASDRKSSIAKWFCQRCNDHYCHNCKTLHDATKIAEDHKPEKLKEFCEQCKRMGQKQQADWHCIECSEYLCDTCKSFHNTFKLTTNHRVVKD